MLDPWYIENLVCPVDRSPLRQDGYYLTSATGRRYPIVQGLPVMLVDQRPSTIDVATKSSELAKQIASGTCDDEFCLSTLGISAQERIDLREMLDVRGTPASSAEVDPVASFLVSATSGIAYKNLIGKLDSYPIPEIPIPRGAGGRLLDIGCNWGRWCLAAARQGYMPVGIDPSLGAVLAARRICESHGDECRFVVGDARFLPFRDASFDRVWSFSVLQHFSRADARTALSEVHRTLTDGGSADIQMPTKFGIRSLWNRMRLRSKRPDMFAVRYYTIPELRRLFESEVGKPSIDIHCFFGLGLLKSDYDYMSTIGKSAIAVSECGRILSKFLPFLKYVADSVYVRSVKTLGER